MTREEASNIWQIIKAYGEGKTIEVYSEHYGKWIEPPEPLFKEGEKYRIKPNGMQLLLDAQISGKTIQTQMVDGEWRDVYISEQDLECDSSFYRIKPEENYTIEQNCGENRVESGVVGISGSVKKTELKEQLESYESYINDIPNVIDPCKQCGVFKKNDRFDYDTIKDGKVIEGKCPKCCWFYPSNFEVGV